jgi:hypothetical protein
MGLLDFFRKNRKTGTEITQPDKPKKVRPEIADKDCWKNTPLPTETNDVSYQRIFTKDEIEIIKKGIIPLEMEDKWFIYCKDEAINIHRSWTGVQIYRVEYHGLSENEFQVTKVQVNGDKKLYNYQGTDEEAKLLNFLIDRLLLKRQVEFAMPTNVPADQGSIFKHSTIGHGRGSGEK